QINYAEVGMTKDQATKCGVLDAWTKAGGASIPSVDTQFDDCNGKLAQDRTACWVAFDKNLMENVVPWVPYLWANAFTIVAPSTTHYEYDQFAGMISLCHIAVNNTATVS